MKKLSIILLLPLLFWLSAPVGFCSEIQTYTISETQLTALQEHLNALERNNSELLNLLNASEMDLTEASLSLNESKKELETLRTQLVVLQAETKQLSESLRIANEELRKASESFKASEKAHARIEGRLRTQRNVWEAIAAVLAGMCIAR
jgi:chromosome segregation ATPase